MVVMPQAMEEWISVILFKKLFLLDATRPALIDVEGIKYGRFLRKDYWALSHMELQFGRQSKPGYRVSDHWLEANKCPIHAYVM